MPKFKVFSTMTITLEDWRITEAANKEEAIKMCEKEFKKDFENGNVDLNMVEIDQIDSDVIKLKEQPNAQ